MILPLLTLSPRNRILLAAIAVGVLLFLLIGASIFISMMEVHFSVSIFSPSPWQKGRATCLRLAALELDSATYLTPIRAELSLRAPGGALPLFQGRSSETTFIDAPFTVPELPAGDYTLLARVETPLGEEELAAPVTIHEPSIHKPPEQQQPSEATPSPPEPPKPAPVHLLPESGDLVPNLENLIYISAPTLPQHLVQVIEVIEEPGFPSRERKVAELRLDAGGMADFRYTPTRGSGKFMVLSPPPPSGEEMGQEWVVELETEPTQILLRPERLQAPAGRPLQLTAFSLRKKGMLLVDLWHRGELAACTSLKVKGESTSITLTPPPLLVGPVLVHAYSNINFPLAAHDTGVIHLVGEERVAPESRAQKLELLLAEEPPYSPPDLLYNSWVEKSERLRLYKQRVRSKLHLVIGALFLLILVGMAFFMLHHHWQARRRRELEGMVRTRALLIILAALGILALAVTSILILLEHLRWS